MTKSPLIKRALLSTSNKTDLIPFARKLHEMGIEIISTGGTSRALREANISHRLVEELTGFAEMLEGRVKTLHPKVHGGILGKRDSHAKEAKDHEIEWIDLVVVNFYPFNEKVKSETMPWSEVVEYIDIGGPTMVRAAAKNFVWVGVVVDPQDYSNVIEELESAGGLTEKCRLALAAKAFEHIEDYDSAISSYFQKRVRGHKSLDLHLLETSELRYGENPHQKASAYQFKNKSGGILSAKQHQGKPLSYNNLLDADAAFNCVQEFDKPCCVIVKHANPCGVAVAQNIEIAYDKAYSADSLSAFGGVVALNQICSKEIAEKITGIFMELVIAPSFTDEALAIFNKKPNLRLLAMPATKSCPWEMRFIRGGVLMQEKDQQKIELSQLQLVTELKPNASQLENLSFAWMAIKHIKSNAILIAKEDMTVGIGGGQVSRIDAVDLAIRKAGNRLADSVLASDGFFPFRDSIDRIAEAGIKAIIQPGGSVKDHEVIQACNEHGIAMAFTQKRCFRH